MAKFADYTRDKPSLRDDYQAWLQMRHLQAQGQGDSSHLRQPNWAEFRRHEEQQGHVGVPTDEPEDLYDVHTRMFSEVSRQTSPNG